LTVTGPRTILTGDSQNFPANVILLLANGFKTQDLLTPVTITGTNNAKLPDLWHQEGNFPSAYMG
jgi:hypothetical protein